MSEQHYFTTPNDREVRRCIRARIWDRDYEFETANGVFSRDGLDLATTVLLRTIDPPTTAERILDLGCGWGPIAIALATTCPQARVDAVDTNQRALDLTRDNAKRNGVYDQVHPCLPSDIAEDVRYDQIWSNPPIRIGKAALHELLRSWLSRLRADGQAQFVVGKNLGADSLQKWLIADGWQVTRVASAKGFRVFTLTKP